MECFRRYRMHNNHLEQWFKLEWQLLVGFKVASHDLIHHLIYVISIITNAEQSNQPSNNSTSLNKQFKRRSSECGHLSTTIKYHIEIGSR